MAITLFGSASNPADNASANEPTTLAITPPGSMVTGDLVTITSQMRNTAGGMAISNAGGQSWTSVAETGAANNQTIHKFWCVFNGTWSANPSVSFPSASGTIPCTAVMQVYRQSTAGRTWSVHQALQVSSFSSPSSPFTVSRAGQAATVNDFVAEAVLATSDDNTFGSLAGSGWAVAGSAQYRNTAGSQQALAMAYYVGTAPGTPPNVSKNMNAGDPGITAIITFQSIAVPDAPTSLAATATEDDPESIDLAWSAPAANGAPITGYKIERESPTGNGFSTLVANTGSTSTAYQDTGLTASTEYNYRVSAINLAGTSSASTADAATTEPPFTLIDTADPGEDEYEVTGLDPGTTYQFYVVHFDDPAESARSNVDDAETEADEDPVEAGVTSGRVLCRAAVLAVALGALAAPVLSGQVQVRAGVLAATPAAQALGVTAGTVQARAGVLPVSLGAASAGITTGRVEARAGILAGNLAVTQASVVAGRVETRAGTLGVSLAALGAGIAAGHVDEGAGILSVSLGAAQAGVVPGAVLSRAGVLAGTPAPTSAALVQGRVLARADLLGVSLGGSAADVTAGRVAARAGILGGALAATEAGLVAGRVEARAGVLAASLAPAAAGLVAGHVEAQAGILGALAGGVATDLTTGRVEARGGVLAVAQGALAADVTAGAVQARAGVLGASGGGVLASVVAGHVQARAGVLAVQQGAASANVVAGRVLARAGVLAAAATGAQGAVLAGQVHARAGVLAASLGALQAGVTSGAVECSAGVLATAPGATQAGVVVGTVSCRAGVLLAATAPLAAGTLAGKVECRAGVLAVQSAVAADVTGGRVIARAGVLAIALTTDLMDPVRATLRISRLQRATSGVAREQLEGLTIVRKIRSTQEA